MGREKLKLGVLFVVMAMVAAMPTEEVVEEVEISVQDIFKDLFVPSREARQLEDETEMVEDVAEDDEDVAEEAVDEAVEDDEAVQAAKQVDIARFNSYMDAIYKRMNAALKAKMMDPMELNLDEKIKRPDQKDKEAKAKKPRRVTKRDADEEEEEDDDDYKDIDEDQEIDHRMGKPDKKKGGARKDAGSKKNKKGKGNKKAEREAAKKEKQKAKAKKQAEREKKRDEKKKKKEQKDGNNRGRRDNNKGKGRSGNRNNQKVHDNKKQNGKKNGRNHNKKARNSKEEKMLGSLSGIATLQRDGDVVVMDEDNHKVVESLFTVGPLKLEVSKVTGRGKERQIKSATARTGVMSGKMILKVKPDGEAYVKKVVFKEPKNVDVKGSLNDNKQRNIRYLKSSVNRMRPLAALRVLKTARFVLKGPSSRDN